MAGKREKGKIPHGEWPNILARYRKGETMAQLARAYGCTAPAIRYILKRSGLPSGEAAGERGAAVSHGSAARSQAPSPVTAAPSLRPLSGHFLGPELRQRVSADVASFLVALDYVDIEGSLESMANLQEATDRLMRSAARTRLELEGMLSRHARSAPREKVRRKAGSPRGNT